MKPECAAAVRAAVGDRQLSDKEMRGIEERLRGAMQTLRRQDPDGWAGMSPSDRLQEAAKLARARQEEDMAAAHSATLGRLEKKAYGDGVIFSLKPGDQLKGMAARHFIDHGRKQSSLESEIRAVRNFYITRLDGKTERLLDDTSKTLALATELKGADSGDPEAKAGAAKVADLLESLRQRRVRAGIPVNKLENYGLPQPWDWTRIGKEEDFVEDLYSWVNTSEFINPDGSQMSPERIDEVLRESWLTLHTNGANKRATHTGQGIGSSVGAKYNAPRQLHFKDAGSWLRAMNKYGTSGSIGGILREHIQRVARDIAIAEREGPMADLDVRQRADQAYANDLAAATTGAQKLKLRAEYQRFLRMWEVQSRGSTIGNATWAARLAAARAVLSASRLGSLVSQQPSDLTMAMTYLKAAGFDKPHALASSFEALASSERKAFLRAAGIWSDNMHETTSRFGDTEIAGRVSNFLNGTVYKMSGMRAADRATTGVIADSVLNTFGRLTREHARLDDLSTADRKWAERYGITQEHWDVMRRAQLDRGYEDDRTALTPDAIYDTPDELLAPLAAKRLSERGATVDEGSLRDEIARVRDDTVKKLLGTFHEVYHAAGRGFAGSSLLERDRLLLNSYGAGTWAGEVIRALWMIRQVPFGLAMTHLWDVPRGMEGWRPRANYVARYIAGQMLATAVAVQLKHLASGEDPEDMTKAAFIKKLTAGAVMGPLMATLVFGSQGEHTEAGVPLGPMGDALQQAIELGLRGRDELNGKPPGEKDRFSSEKYAAEWLAFVRSNAVPFANMWYTKAAFNHLIYQQLQESISPGYSERVRARMRKENRNTWWSPGEALPHREPDWGAAVGRPAD